MGGGFSETLSGSVGLTVALAGASLFVCAVSYVTNKRRSPDAVAGNKANLQSGFHQRQSTGGTVEKDESVTNSRVPVYAAAPRSATDRVNGPYYAALAERHVSRHDAATMEWRDDVLGVRMLFSPILFAVETEERQAPLLLVGLRYLRQPEHRVAITFECCGAVETAEEYRENSLDRIRSCAKLLSSAGYIRIGSEQLPSAEYCYMDSGNKLRFALSVFLTNGQLAVTAQYIADTRVKSVLPTAFNELVRSIQFITPRATPSYLLCSEPRLGLGFRLPLDFFLDDALQEFLMLSEDKSITSVPTPLGPYGTGDDGIGVHYSLHRRHGRDGHNMSNAAGSTVNVVSSVTDTPWNRGVAQPSPDACVSEHSIGGYKHNGRSDFCGSSTAGNLSTPFASLSNGGPRKILIVSCYEPLSYAHLSWQSLFEHHIRTVMQRFSIRYCGDGVSAFSVTVVRGNDELQPLRNNKHKNFVVQLQQVTVSMGGDNGGDDDANTMMELEGALCVQEMSIDLSSVCASHLHYCQSGRQDEGVMSCTDPPCALGDRKEAGNTHDEQSIDVYLSIFLVRINCECVSMTFLFPTVDYTLEEAVKFCRRTIDTMSLGNHYGQGTSLVYFNKRHEVLPFSVLLNPVSTAAATLIVVEEPVIGEPLATFHVGRMDGVAVHLRVFPIPLAVDTLEASRRRTASRLERLVRKYLLLLPGQVRVHRWEATAIGTRAALEVHYEQLCFSDDEGSGSELAAADKEVCRINPFTVVNSLCFPQSGREDGLDSPKPRLSSVAMAPSVVPHALTMQSTDQLLMRAPSMDSREESALLQVAVIVCCEACAFLFLAASGGYPVTTVRQVVWQVASNLSVLSSSTL
uniref:Present in the outer mitochondrial membrane proteome 34 n=1 Tax=Trypanosoma congolense (strain IL3000) TaxID=1068625 RepID=G0UQD1_TRYCI|nr:conserved hypothetical protein [Trypanosoma congolense IL3000]